MSMFIELIGYAAALAVAATYSMKTMIPLRTVGIVSNVLFILYGAMTLAVPILILHLVLLPLNSVRLYEMLRLVKRVSVASKGELTMEWLKPFMSERATRAGEIVFRAGDLADTMFVTGRGSYRLQEIDLEIKPGEVIGELGLVTEGNRRTLSLECVEDGQLFSIPYDQLKQLYFQNPTFGFALLRIIGARLQADIERLRLREDAGLVTPVPT